MRIFFAGSIFGFFLLVAAAYLFVVSGAMPVSTRGKALPFEKFLARTAIRAAVKQAIGTQSPLVADGANFSAGAAVYQVQCAVCHGSLGKPESKIARGMFPHPPQLLPPRKGASGDPVGEVYWKVKYGIRLTGMPGYGDSLTETELWQVSLLLVHAHEIPATALDLLRD